MPVEGYKVYRSTSSSSGYVLVAEVEDTSYIDNDVSNGISYYYFVVAFNSMGEGPPSTGVTTMPGDDGRLALVIVIVSSVASSAAIAAVIMYTVKERGRKTKFPWRRGHQNT